MASKPRLPRGTKPVVRAFFQQLRDQEQKPGNSDPSAVAKAALAEIQIRISESARRGSRRGPSTRQQNFAGY